MVCFLAPRNMILIMKASVIAIKHFQPENQKNINWNKYTNMPPCDNHNVNGVYVELNNSR